MAAQNKDTNRGFSLIELVISIAILTIALLALLQTFTLSSRLNQKAGVSEKVQYLASNVMERIKGQDLNELASEVRDGGGSLDKKIGQETYHISIETNGRMTLTTNPDNLIYGGRYYVKAVVDPSEYANAVTAVDSERQKVLSINNYIPQEMRNASAATNFVLDSELAYDQQAADLLTKKTGSDKCNRFVDVEVITAAGSGSEDAQVTVRWRSIYSTAETLDGALADESKTILWPVETANTVSEDWNELAWYSETKMVKFTDLTYKLSGGKDVPLLDSALYIVCPEEKDASGKTDTSRNIKSLRISAGKKNTADFYPMAYSVSGIVSANVQTLSRVAGTTAFPMLDLGKTDQTDRYTNIRLKDGSSSNRLYKVSVAVYNQTGEEEGTGSALYSLESTKQEEIH